MMNGLPVICSNSDIWKKIIDNEKCGICVEPDNTKEIANAINYLLDNPDIAIQMGENGKNAVKERYNWQTQEDILLKMYENLK